VSSIGGSGSELEFSTYLGGSLLDQAWGFALDKKGNAYVAGGTTSTNFPVTPDSLQTTNHAGNNGVDAFVYKLSCNHEGHENNHEH
jgi:beta-propeller repeat-containing protein